MIPKNLALGFLLVGITLFAYSSAISGGFIWDDDDYVIENPTLRSAEGLRSIWLDPSATPQYYPLVHSSFWIEYQLWGLWPAGYHTVNVLLHIGNALLLWRLLARLEVPAAWLAAMVFAVHPVHVESVAWITERKNVLSGFFYFTAVLSFLRYWNFSDEDFSTATRRRGWYVISAICFLFAMWSKTVTATLPAALCVLIWWKRGRIQPRVLLVLSPMFVVGISLGLLTVWLEKHQVGAEGIDWELSLIDRCLIAGRAILFYAGKLVWPVELTFIYPRWQIDSTALWQYTFPALVVATIVLLWLYRHRLGRGPLAAVLFFAGTLFPALGFFDVYPMRFSFVADHFQYLASIGLIALIIAAAAYGSKRVFSTAPVLPKVLAGLMVLALATLTWQQGRIYQGLEILWRDTLDKNWGAFLAHNNLGALLNRRGDYAEAEFHLREAVRIKPDFVDSQVNLGKAYEGQGELQKAEQSYRQATELNPSYPAALNGLGAVHGMQGETELAEHYLRRAVELQPDYAQAHANLGILYSMTGRIDEAIQAFETAIALDPSLSEAHANFARVLMSQQKFDRARQIFEGLLSENPDDLGTLLNLGVIAANQERQRTAINYFEKVLQLDPTHLQATYNLGAMHQMVGETERANTYFRRYEQLSGGSPR